MPRKQNKVLKYGYIVRAGKVRTGCDSPMWLSDDRPVGLTSHLNRARFHAIGEKDAVGQDAHTQARQYACWQLGTVLFAAMREDGTLIELQKPEN